MPSKPKPMPSKPKVSKEAFDSFNTKKPKPSITEYKRNKVTKSGQGSGRTPATNVRVADNKATKAANAKAPRYPRGMQGYGMDTSKGGVSVTKRGDSTIVVAAGSGKKTANSLVKSAVKSKAAGVRGKMTSRETDFGDFGSFNKLPTSIEYRKYQSKSSPKKKSR